MQEQVAQSLDPVLVRRLWRPAERPGVIDLGPARAMLARHQGMVSQRPLAELMARHTGSAPEPAGTVPIVYALPAQPPPTPDSPPRRAPSAACGSGPIVAGVAVQPYVSGTVPPVLHATPSLVVQREVDTQAPPGSRSTPSVAPPGGVRPEVSRAEVSRAEVSRVEVSRVEVTPPGAPHPEAASPGWASPGGTLPGGTLPDLRPLRLWTPVVGQSEDRPSKSRPQSATAPGGAPGEPRAARTAVDGAPAGPSPRTSLPLVQITARSRHNGSTGQHLPGAAEPVVAVAAPTPWSNGQHSARPTPYGSVDQAHPAPANVVSHPLASLHEPLLLVDLAAISRSAEDRSGTAERRDPVSGRTDRPPVAGEATSPAAAARHAPGAARSRRPPTAELDVEHLVDRVHRRFVRGLAIEAERRAVR